MCGIAGALSLSFEPVPDLAIRLAAMDDSQRHRGPDGRGFWIHQSGALGFAHGRLAVIDVRSGGQPMDDGEGGWIVANGEVYNYLELRQELGTDRFRTSSDTECILRGYRRWDAGVVDHLRGMFAFALWDEQRRTLFCARDRFGIKPFYYAVMGGVLHFASEVKALLPFLPAVETDPAALREYLSFQFCLEGRTLFAGVRELPPAHVLLVHAGRVEVRPYWEVSHRPDLDHTPRWFESRLRELLEESVTLHLRADVPIGAYVSGGLDSGIVAALAAARGARLAAFTGKFSGLDGFDESHYARELAASADLDLVEVDIGPDDFVDTVQRVVQHLDFPVAGPGSFAQFVVSREAARHRKVLLGGQGGDEIFGGYARYLVAYLDQCIKRAVEGTLHDGSLAVTYQSIIPNLVALRQYRPMLREFWREGLFEDLDRRYYRLVNRASTADREVNWDALGPNDSFETFQRIFHAGDVERRSSFDAMMHFDFKTLLPALLQVEDRVSMAHGLESRVPFLDHPLVEFAASIPAGVKFENGSLKHVLRRALGHVLPRSILGRTDKMGFPVPLQDWIKTEPRVRDFVRETLTSSAAFGREVIDYRAVAAALDREPAFSRKVWGFLCLELWQRSFHDRAAALRRAAAAAHPPAD